MRYLLSMAMLGLGLYTYTIGANPSVALIPFISSFIGEYLLKRVSETKREKVIESELPSTISHMIASLDSGVSLTEVIRDISKSNTEIGRIMSEVLTQVSSGVSLPIALESSKKRVKSKYFRKFINKVIMMYRFGGTTAPLEQLETEINEMRKIELKRYASKTMMYSLILIATSSVVPAMFLAYLVVGSVFLKVNLTPIDAFLIPVFVFPSINSLIIILMQMNKPVVS